MMITEESARVIMFIISFSVKPKSIISSIQVSYPTP